MVTVRVNVTRELARFKKFGPEGRVELRDFMRRHGRALISSSGSTPGIVQLSPPHSQGVRGQKAKVQGETAVSADINKVYGSPGKLYAKIREKTPGAAVRFWQAVKKKDWATANEISRSVGLADLREFDDGAAHDARRTRRGRVGGKEPSIYLAQMSGGDPKKPGPWLRSYIKTIQKRVGLLAAALIPSAEARLGKLAGVPAWIRRHAGSAAGSAATTLLENSSGLTVTAIVSSPRLPHDYQRRMDYTAGYRLNAMRSDLPRTAKRMEAKLQQGL